jgi:endonuclease/exonuclease/phosphatase family metal-dependent hydrolase
VVAPVRPASLTLATFNTHLGVDGWGRPFDVVEACRSLGADVLVLQESWAPVDGGPSTAAEVARALGYAVVAERALARGRLFGPVATTSTRWGPPMVPWQGSFRLDGEHRGHDGRRAGSAHTPGAWGLALLSRLPVLRSTVIPLKKLRRDAARRVVIGCTIELDGATVEVFGTHMSHITHGSHLQYRRLRDLLPPLTAAAVLAGDMNLWGPPVNSYLRGWRRALIARTWPAHRPHSQLDHILVTPAVDVLDARVGSPTGSDHLPVVATLAPARRPGNGTDPAG